MADIYIDRNALGAEPTIELRCSVAELTGIAGAIEGGESIVLPGSSVSDVADLHFEFDPAQEIDQLSDILAKGGPSHIMSTYSERYKGHGIVVFHAARDGRRKFATSIRNIATSGGHGHFEWYTSEGAWFTGCITWIIGVRDMA